MTGEIIYLFNANYNKSLGMSLDLTQKITCHQADVIKEIVSKEKKIIIEGKILLLKYTNGQH